MFIPYLCILLFSIIGTWMLIDPIVAYYIVNIPEIIGRVTLLIYFQIIVQQPIVDFHLRLIPIRSIFFYSDLLQEIEQMATIPLGGEKKDCD